MSHGQANVIVLYDKAGNPVEVVLQNNSYRLVTTDMRTHDRLDEIKLLLMEMLQVLRESE